MFILGMGPYFTNRCVTRFFLTKLKMRIVRLEIAVLK